MEERKVQLFRASSFLSVTSSAVVDAAKKTEHSVSDELTAGELTACLSEELFVDVCELVAPKADPEDFYAKEKQRRAERQVRKEEREKRRLKRREVIAELRANGDTQKQSAEKPEATGTNDVQSPERSEPKPVTKLANRYNLSRIEAKELCNLLADMAPLEFTRSKQLSNHIKENRLGRDYPNISGIVKMKKGDDEWDFEGGFPPKIYAILCGELGVSNEGTKARPVGFTPFEELYDDTNE
jgi:hypothetical protein